MEPSIQLDEQDRRLIAHLQADARASYQELAEQVGVSPSTARRRVERLLASNVLKLVAVPSWLRLGFNLIAFIGISVDLACLRSVGAELRAMDEVCFVAITAGGYDLFAQVVLPTNEDLVRFVTHRLAPIPGVRNLQTFMVPAFVKSFEEYRLPVQPNPLYLRASDGDYALSEDRLIAK